MNIEAGRELDALIAEKVMGLHPEQTTDLGGSRCEHWYSAQGKVSNYGPPKYSTDIAAAWQVFDAISVIRKNIKGQSPDGYSYDIYKPMIRLEWYEHDECAAAIFGRCKSVGEFDTDVRAHADTIPLAICKLALMVVAL